MVYSMQARRAYILSLALMTTHGLASDAVRSSICVL